MKLSLPLVGRTEVAERTMSFAFDLKRQAFPFQPGQYVQISQGAPRHEDEKGNSRSFSIASSPNDPTLLIATRLTGSAFKRSLAEVTLGTRVDVQGPMGSFVLPQDVTKPVALVAGGIGVTPFRSMIKTVTVQKLPHRLTLIYSNRTPQGAPFLEELEGWEMENPNFRLVATMTSPENSRTPWQRNLPVSRRNSGKTAEYSEFGKARQRRFVASRIALRQAHHNPGVPREMRHGRGLSRALVRTIFRVSQTTRPHVRILGLDRFCVSSCDGCVGGGIGEKDRLH